MPRKIILYSADLCGDCQKLKAFMDEHGIDYELRDIHADPSNAEAVKENTGKLGVPFLVVDGEWVRGYDCEGPFTEDFARRALGM